MPEFAAKKTNPEARRQYRYPDGGHRERPVTVPTVVLLGIFVSHTDGSHARRALRPPLLSHVGAVCHNSSCRLCSQRVLAIELKHDGDSLSGNLVLPFGLLLNAGVTLQVDEQQPQEPIEFLTCLPAGCLARLSFDADAVNTLRGGAALKVKVQGTDQKETVLSVSLKGLATALDRLKVLSGA